VATLIQADSSGGANAWKGFMGFVPAETSGRESKQEMTTHMEVLLTEEQTHKLLETLQGHWFEILITLALVTGARRNELLNLTWRQVDLEKCEMHVLNAKTRRSSRQARLSEDVTRLLKQHRLRQRETQDMAATAWFDRDLVFSNETGGFLGAAQLLQRWHEVREQAGLPSLRLHDLRVDRVASAP
jgi:integrase